MRAFCPKPGECIKSKVQNMTKKAGEIKDRVVWHG
jgi:hypothetical protein